MGLFDNVFNRFMKDHNLSKDVGTYDKNDKTNAKTEKDTEESAFIKENSGKVIVKRRFVINFFGDKPKYGYVSKNYMVDDIRRLTIKKRMLGGYSLITTSLNSKKNRGAKSSVAIGSFNELKSIIEKYKTAQISVFNWDDEVFIEMVSNREKFDFKAIALIEDSLKNNPSDFVFADASGLTDWPRIEKAITKVVAAKLGKSVEEIKNDDEVLPNDWAFEEHNQSLSKYAMSKDDSYITEDDNEEDEEI